MVQVKKSKVREAILSSAFTLFRERGYTATTLAAIASRAGIATASLYVYFDSKLAILFEIYRPWLEAHFERLEQRLAQVTDRRRRLELILTTFWSEIPAAENGFANNLMQAFADVEAPETYNTGVLELLKTRLSALLADSLPPERGALVRDDRLVHLLFMAFDGFVLNYHMNQALDRNPGIIALFCALLEGRPIPKARLAEKSGKQAGRRTEPGDGSARGNGSAADPVGEIRSSRRGSGGKRQAGAPKSLVAPRG